MFRRRRQEPPPDPLAGIDPRALAPRWAAHVTDALAARARWQAVVGGIRPGPVRDRMTELSVRVDDGVRAVWDTAQRAHAADEMSRSVEAERVTDEYKRARRDPSVDPALMAALTARFTSTQRILNTVEDADDRLRLLDARLGALVARAAEVAVTAGDDGTALGRELESVVAELGAVRDSLASLS
ncbi:hypothetical protein [Actinomarinicola tropica]|uniref:Uncharacterized protein n=1 Tax=Actinomarinicola tropica TaxID=2789776 RepID=A0A5Q2RHR2_9ACTN|nr:hypothetical protein [Actinomarinicola tropica]QGG94422.1 hypothetical protein GH723_04495 [Actinomarinicola tropica]